MVRGARGDVDGDLGVREREVVEEGGGEEGTRGGGGLVG